MRITSDFSANSPLDRVRSRPTRTFRKYVAGFLAPEIWFLGVTFLIIAVGASISTETGPATDSKQGELRIHSGRIEAVALSPDGRTGASASRDGRLKIWRASGRKGVLVELKGISGYSSLAYAPDGQTLVAGGLDGSVTLLRVETAAEIMRLSASRLSIRAVAFAPDGRSFSASGDDGLIRSWDAKSGEQSPTIEASSGCVHALSYNKSGTILASSGQDGSVMLWNPTSRGLIRRIDPALGLAWSLDFAPDGQSIAVGGAQGIRILSVPEGTARRIPDIHSPITAVRFAPDGTKLVSTRLDGTVELWSLLGDSPTRLQLVSTMPSRVKALAISTDGLSLVTGADDAILRFSRIKGVQ